MSFALVACQTHIVGIGRSHYKIDESASLDDVSSLWDDGFFASLDSCNVKLTVFLADFNQRQAKDWSSLVFIYLHAEKE